MLFRSAQKMALDAAAAADKQELDKEKVQGDLQLKAMQASALIEQSKAKLMADQERDGLRMGIDIAKSRAEAARAQAENLRNRSEKEQRRR